MAESSSSPGGRRTDAVATDNHPLPLELRAGNTDESPTVITKCPVRMPTGDEAIAHSVRGRKLAHFELIAPIGVGGMAAVLKARDLQLDRTVALKILPPDMAADAENVRRFHQEARAAAKLDHENIARVFYCGEDQNLHFIAFEFVQGENLRTVLDRRHRLPVGEALHALIQIASGLAHAHHRGVVHRDIKPSNIIVTPTGRAKLVDMGLARSLSPQHGEEDLTQSGVTLGTFDYISPEQALEPRDADVRSDIYSLGCTFYHLLTGQAPVPEGTAAKKLHHHQHVPPIDPRELNPDVPDEVAVVLSRMMAKNPADRYARPEQLVQHLLRVAQRLEGVSSGVNQAADGMVMVDAPLPGPAAPARPLLLGAVALAAVVTLVLVFTQAPGRPRQSFQPSRVAPGGEAKDKASAHPGGADPGGLVRPGPTPGNGNTTQAPAPATFTYGPGQKHAELREFLRKLPAGSEAEILLAADLVLPGDGATAADEPGLVFKGRKITIRPEKSHQRPTIWFAYDGQSRDKATDWAALLLEADEVTLQGLRVIVEARESQLRLTGVLIRGGKRHVVEDCQFFQTAPAFREEQRLGSLVFEAGTRPESRPTAVVRDCAFVGSEESESKPGDTLSLGRLGRGGQDAVTRVGPVQVQISHCAFGPHVACVRLEGAAEGAEQYVSVEHCSALLADGSAVLLAARDASAQVRVARSLLARAPRRGMALDMGAGRGPVLIRQAAEDAAGLRYHGDDNRYYNLEGYLAAGMGEPLDWDEFQAHLAPAGCEDRSQVLESSPWQEEDPLGLLGGQKLARAFQVQEKVRELRVSGNERKLIGVARCAGVSYVSDLPVLERKNPPVARKEKVFDPRLTESGNGQYPTLGQALADARDGDVILVKANGVVAVKPVKHDRANVEVTIKPAPGCKPVLTADTQDRDATLFYVQEGKLNLAGLAFRVQPAGTVDSDATQAVVALQGEGSCKFTDCVITLAEPRGAALAVAYLADPGKVMMKKPAPSSGGPRLAFENCLVRGKGDLVWCRSNRAFKVEMSQTLTALTGSLLHIDGPGDAMASGDAQMPVVLDMKNVTACLNEHLVSLGGARDLKGLPPIQCKSNNCLFLSLAGKALIHLEGMEATEDKVKERLTWEGSSNAYGNFMEMLDQQPRGTEMRPPAFGEDAWKRLSSESDARFARVKVASAPEATALPRAKPEQFKTTDVTDAGANLDLVPTPPPDERP